MPAVQIPWPITSLPGKRPGESQGLLVNAYATKVAEDIVIRRVAGLKKFGVSASPAKIPRGQLNVADKLLHAWDNELYVASPNGTSIKATGGALYGSKPITMAKNMRPNAPQVAIVTENGPLAFDMATNALIAYPTSGYAAVTSVEYHSGYFFFTQLDGTIVASELQQLEIVAGSSAYAEYTADKLYRVKSTGAALAVMSESSIEFWVDVGATPFPLQRQQSIDVGLLSMWAVAGGSNEWENGLLWVAGDWTVRRLNGYRADIVSNDAVTRDIRACRYYTDLRAQVYVFNAQAIWSLSCPDWTWEYNLTTGAWHKRHSYGAPAWRSSFATWYQNKWIGQDLLRTGNLWEIDHDAFDEDGRRLHWLVESAPLKEFPANFRIPSIDIDMTVGLGDIDSPTPDPTVLVSWSHDGGANWGNPVARSMGREGRYATKVTVNSLGRSTAQGVMFRLEVTDPVWVQLVSAIATRAKVSRPRAVNA